MIVLCKKKSREDEESLSVGKYIFNGVLPVSLFEKITLSRYLKEMRKLARCLSKEEYFQLQGKLVLRPEGETNAVGKK